MSQAKRSDVIFFLRDLYKSLTSLRGSLDRKRQVGLSLLGIALTVFVWWFVVHIDLVAPQILPCPSNVFSSVAELHFNDALIRNLAYSIKLNLLGYGFAILIGLPTGFILGLLPIFRGLSIAPINALRYLPLAAATGLFIMWFGTDDTMKVAFLAFSIVVYLVPTVIQRIDEVDQTYIDSLTTIGGKGWNMVYHVYLPDVVSRVWNDVIVLVAISWTYIILAELINRSAGGVGALIYTARRQSRPDKMFAILIIIMIVGLLQDRLFRYIGKVVFPYRFTGGEKS